MKLFHRTAPFLVILGFMCFISPALGADPLTDHELNEIGAGGVNSSPPPPHREL